MTSLPVTSSVTSRPQANPSHSQERIKIVVWDKVGNVMWGVRPWDEWSLRAQSCLLAENPNARAHAPSFAELFKDYNIHLRHVESVEELATEIGDADFLVVHKNNVPPEVLRRRSAWPRRPSRHWLPNASGTGH